MIKTFRGMIQTQTQDTIVLHTNDGSMGYRILKFQVISESPTTASAESIVKIYKVPQTTIGYKVDFSDNTLLGVAVWSTNATAEANPEDMTVLFDREIFNQDIYITHYTTTGSEACNYYLELEQVKLDVNERTVATLKDIRNTARTIT